MDSDPLCSKPHDLGSDTVQHLVPSSTTYSTVVDCRDLEAPPMIIISVRKNAAPVECISIAGGQTLIA
jgi:hypothetical protein